MNAFEMYEKWMNSSLLDDETLKELKNIKENKTEIEDRFYKDLEFGTGGLRGVIGAGTNRMNIYTVRRASQGFANYLSVNDPEAAAKGIVIAFDSRHKSAEFAAEAAKVFAGNGIKAYLFDELRPTPELSFAVRFLGASGGVVVTASHNPKEYNGYKAYGADGAQLSPEDSLKVTEEIDKINDFDAVKIMNKEEALTKGLIKIIGDEIDNEYIYRLKTLTLNPMPNSSFARDLKIIYTPLHGAGNKLVRRILSETGFENVLVVKEQELPDPDFSTVKSPNPEDRNAFKLAIEMAGRENVDLIVGTDPDCDRVGVVVKNAKGEYAVLTGNQTGCLLLEYILSQKKASRQLPSNGFVVKTIVTSELVRAIADCYGTELVEVLTGFKFIGEQIRLLDEKGNKKYLFGMEESYGYLAGTFSRDKDGVVTCMLIAEMALQYSMKGKTLYDGLKDIFNKYGYYLEDSSSFNVEGKQGLESIDKTMTTLRKERIGEFGGLKAKALRDYQLRIRYDFEKGAETALNLPVSNVLYYEMTDGSWFCVRPSGTEPKIKIYYGVSDKTPESASQKLQTLKSGVIEVVKEMLGVK